MDKKIDFVIIWVDDGDKEWQKMRNKYAGKDPEDVADIRYRDWENLKYWFRGVEKFAPWVNNIYFITCGHYPKWLNLNHPKLKFVKHEDYIPSEFLPTFSSHPIELNLHRIKELSEHFVYFCDDMFLTNPVVKEDFFVNGIPKNIAALDLNMTNDKFGHILLNNVTLTKKYHPKNATIIKNWNKWFNLKYGFKFCLRTLLLMKFEFVSYYYTHMPAPMLKSVNADLWKKEEDFLNEISSHKFREISDVSQSIFIWDYIQSGNFVPARKKDMSYYRICSNNEKLVRDLKKRKYKMICLNDASSDYDFEKAKKEIIDAFEEILPEKSSFEL